MSNIVPNDDVIMFERLKMAVQSKLNDEQMQRAAVGIEWQIYRMMESTYIKLVKMVTARRIDGKLITKRESYQVPAGRLDHFKLAILDERGRLDRWILRHWPVKYNPREVVLYVRVDRWETFPENTIVPEEFGEPVFVQNVREVDNPYD